MIPPINTVCCVLSPNQHSEVTTTIQDIVNEFGGEVILHEVTESTTDIDWRDIDLVVSVGGDGTFLEAVQLTYQVGTPILSINTGTLGFLARISPENAEDAVRSVINDSGEINIVPRELLQVSGAVTGTGINDVMVEPVEPESPTDRKIATIHAYVGEEYVGEFTGSGIAVATPTGSTAVSYSAGGPVHYPNANASLQLTPLLTHKGGIRPIIVDSDTTIRIIPEHEVTVSIDGGRVYEVIDSMDEIQVAGGEKQAQIVRTSFDESFFDALSGKLGWGVRGVDDVGPVPEKIDE